MRKDEIQGFVNSIRAKSPLELTNGVIDDNVESYLINAYNSHMRMLSYERMRKKGIEPRALVLNLHGGGFVKGITTRDRVYCSYLAMNTESEIWNADYSLAPEFPFPCALEDAYDLLKKAEEEKRKRSIPLILVGHSAGAWLITALCIYLERRGEDNPIDGAIIDYPPLDFIRSFQERVFDPSDESQMKFAKTVEVFTMAYCPSGDRSYGLLSPLYAKDEELRAFPKTFLTVGELDTLYPEDIKFAKRLESLHRPITYKLYPDSGHSFTTNRTGRFDEAISDHADFINSLAIKPCTGKNDGEDGKSGFEIF